MKYFEEEVKQKAKLEKLIIMRDLEAEQARVQAVSPEIEADSYSANIPIAVNRPSDTFHDPSNTDPAASFVDRLNPHSLSNDELVFNTQNTLIVSNSDDAVNNNQVVSSVCNRVNDQVSKTADRGSGIQVETQSEISNALQPGCNYNAPVFYPPSQQLAAVDVQGHSEVSKLIEKFSEFVNMSRLPVPEPGVFTGDPLEYPAWRSAFSALIENRSIPPAECVHFLKRYLGGKARACVEGFLLMPTADSYREAVAVIEKRFGDKLTVALAFKSKIESWPRIASRDVEGLRRFSDFLRQCEIAARHNPSLNVLDDDCQSRVMVSKLPDWLVARWARVVSGVRERTQMFPKFSEFVSFLGKEADIANEPVTNLQISNDKKPTQPGIQSSGKTLNTVSQPCLCCEKSNHTLEKCFKFKAFSRSDKQAFIKRKGLCFGCLSRGHLSKNCRQRLKCETCDRGHPTVLHDHADSANQDENRRGGAQSTIGKESVHKNNQDKLDTKGQTTTAQRFDKTDAVSLFANYGYSNKSTMVVPVYLTCKTDPQKEVLTYALLDTQSDTSFISNDVVAKLGITGVNTTLFLSTMTSQSTPVQCTKYTGLSVRGHDCNTALHLPPLFSQEFIPANQGNIPTFQIAERWPYLKPMIHNLMPKFDCGIGLLIGFNCPKALAPREVIPPEGNGPFAQRTDLGWGIVGMLDGTTDDNLSFSFNHHLCSDISRSVIALRTSAKEVIGASEIMKISDREENYGLSVDDNKFLQEVEVHDAGQTGPYSLGLPCDEFKASCFSTEATVDVLELFPLRNSSWPATKRVTAIILKFISNLRNKQRGWITTEDIHRAELFLLRRVQKAAFSLELDLLRSPDQHIPSSSRLYKLDPFLDENDLIRIGGRIKDSSLVFEERHPVVLPKKHEFTDSIVSFCHEKVQHQGRGITMSEVRGRGYWILGLSSVVANHKNRCIPCRKLRSSPVGQKMAPLPDDRLQPGSAFTYVATDCFGPFFIQERRKELKDMACFSLV